MTPTGPNLPLYRLREEAALLVVRINLKEEEEREVAVMPGVEEGALLVW